MHSAVAHLAGGMVQGSQCVNAPAFSFQGIPFAEPPVEKLRFFPPKSFNRTFDGNTLDATRQPHPCIQWTKSEFAVEDPTPSEDCLYLNVFVPKDKPKKLPVKVFTYGGSNIEGALNYPLYNGCNLATDAVVVTFNYRLGPLGFLHLQDANIKGNMALQDYIAALQWVKSNVEHFDGDPTQVMLFAQSAGAANAFAMSTMDNITDYVSAIVLESGGGQDVTPKETAQLAGESFSKTLNCSTSDINCIQSKSVDELMHAFHHAPALLENGRSLGVEFGIHLPNRTNINSVIIDGDIIKDQPLKVGSQVPIIAGSNSHDSSLFVLPNYSGSDITNSTWQNFLKQWGTYADKVDEQYPLCGFKNDILEAIVHVTTMSGFLCPTFKALRASKQPAFAYAFNHTPSCPWMWVKGKEFPKSGLFGPTHTSELPFTLANIDFQPETNGSCNGTKEERDISDFMVSAWTSMAVRSRPHDMWPAFNASDPRGLRLEGKASFETLDFSECNFWDDIWAQMGGVNFSTPQGFNQSWPYDKSCQSNGHILGIRWGLLVASIIFISFLQT